MTGIIKTKELGLEVFKVVIRGTVVSTHLSEYGARIKALRIVNNINSVK